MLRLYHFNHIWTLLCRCSTCSECIKCIIWCNDVHRHSTNPSHSLVVGSKVRLFIQRRLDWIDNCNVQWDHSCIHSETRTERVVRLLNNLLCLLNNLEWFGGWRHRLAVFVVKNEFEIGFFVSVLIVDKFRQNLTGTDLIRTKSRDSLFIWCLFIVKCASEGGSRNKKCCGL